MQAELNGTYINVTVGLGRWPEQAHGTLLNANSNINEIAARDGRVLTAPFLFTDLYHHHADSWTVPPEQSLLDACGESRRGVRLTATITFSADFKTVTLQPNSNLIGAGATCYFEISYQAQLWDVGGNVLNYGYIQFTTQ